ncbi:microtubule-associated protein 70-5 isoform X2 [Tripterygium wilfordii]|uniref:Microtubule-associated protein 70-5 isoform X2 n=1 Tax=Tripterygium wilfordii TaxID=458696 RepID=A0A7J7D9T9_TRIWF|nr:microtubule-associated protein 70-5 isoform X2 [Tripterygium wilfordii]
MVDQLSLFNLTFYVVFYILIYFLVIKTCIAEKDRELGFAQGEIKALRATEVLKDKAIEEVRNEVNKLDKKLSATENLLQYKNLEIKKLTSEKKDALAAQYAAEATLRRVHENQKDDDSFPIESVIAPLEAEIKLYKNKIATLQEDKKALERLTKSKESALLEAERILRSALERALVVEEVQNQNFELKRQIEICQVRLKTLEEGLKHVSSYSVNPNTFSGSLKTEKSIIFGFLTDSSGLKKRSSSQPRASTTGSISLSQQSSSGNETEQKQANSIRTKSTSVENMLRKSLWASRSKIIDSSGKENTQIERHLDANLDKFKDNDTSTTILAETKNKSRGNEEAQNMGNPKDQEICPVGEDMISGFLYDRLQKEVINLRKACEVKEDNLNAKDQEIKVMFLPLLQVTPSFSFYKY